MLNIAAFTKQIFVLAQNDFDAAALALFKFQAHSNRVYADYLQLLGRSPESVERIEQIPFLPVGLFRNRQVLCAGVQGTSYFESSGTTDAEKSRHYYDETAVYDASILRGFSRIYGVPAQYTFLALLPSYLDRPHASLVHMCRVLMQASGDADSGFFSGDTDTFLRNLQRLEVAGRKTIVIGVSFALLALAEKHPIPLQHAILMETGGMKGRSPEITRAALHKVLSDAFGIDNIHSEYGMTEMFSQAYAVRDGIFQTPPWMRVLTRDPSDPLCMLHNGENGCLNIIDLANVHSCAFLATDDIGRVFPDGHFEVSGRNDNSAMRGCNILYANTL
ncbi:MAG: acyl transferase [Chitinophagales bacterium]